MIVNALFNLRWRQFRRACADPLRAQAARLRDTLRAAARTELGHSHRFDRIARIADPVALIAA